MTARAFTKNLFTDKTSEDYKSKRQAQELKRYIKVKRRQSKQGLFRLYIVNNALKAHEIQAKGYYKSEDGKIYRDKISFKDFDSFDRAKAQALKLLKESSEICIALEHLSKAKLFIVYRDKLEVLSIKRVIKTKSKRQALKHVKAFNYNATVTKDKSYYKIVNYQ